MIAGLSGRVRVAEYHGLCRISTGFALSDGDGLWIILEERDGRWILTDQRRTLSWLSDQHLEMTDSRYDALQDLLRGSGVRCEDGELIREISDQPDVDLRLFITAVISVSNLTLLNRRTVRNTFLDDVKGMFQERFPECETGKVLSTDRGERFRVDVYVDREKPLLVFGVRTKDRCKDASLAIMALSEDMKFDSVAIVDEVADIPKRDLEFLRNRAGSVMTLDEARGAEL